MPSTTLEQAGEMMERLRLAISEQHFEFGDIQVTASFGVTVLRESQTVKESINCADKAMYEAKSAGRDRVVLDV
jgi:diguanylate cyclase (GGDEF)-like protein